MNSEQAKAVARDMERHGCNAMLILDGWAGRERVPCTIIGETPKRYRIKLGASAMLPGKRRRDAGDVVLVPKYAVKKEEDQAQ